MAEDWIKMRPTMFKHPKVCLMADRLLPCDETQNETRRSTSFQSVSQPFQSVSSALQGVTRNVIRNAVVGALVSVWGIIRHRGTVEDDDILIEGATIALVDDLADLPGFGQAMAFVGWVVQDENGIRFPAFFSKFNVAPKKKTKTSSTERVRRHREKKRAETAAAEPAEAPVTPNVDVTPVTPDETPLQVAFHPTEREKEEEREGIKKEDSLEPLPARKPTPQIDPADIVLTFPTVGTGDKEWHATRTQIKQWQAAYPGLDVRGELNKALAWVNANPTKRKTARGMAAFLVNWFNRATQRGGGQTSARTAADEHLFRQFSTLGDP